MSQSFIYRVRCENLVFWIHRTVILRVIFLGYGLETRISIFDDSKYCPFVTTANSFIIPETSSVQRNQHNRLQILYIVMEAESVSETFCFPQQPSKSRVPLFVSSVTPSLQTFINNYIRLQNSMIGLQPLAVCPLNLWVALFCYIDAASIV
jgi:hypothetical protein